jgi:hypothetical protein
VRAGRGRDDDRVRRLRGLLRTDEDAQSVLPGDLLGAPLVVVVDSGEAHAAEPGGDARVVPAQVADPDDRQPHGGAGGPRGAGRHLMKPRSLPRMKPTSSSTSG